MNRDTVIRIAVECGLKKGQHWDASNMDTDHVLQFANKIAEAKANEMRRTGWRRCATGQATTQHCGLLEAAVAAEREACARVSDEIGGRDEGCHAWDVLAAIRARGET